MEKIADMALGPLKGRCETITVMELRSSPGEVFDQVLLGKRYIITRNGKPVAEINPLEPTALDLGAAVRKLGLAGD